MDMATVPMVEDYHTRAASTSSLLLQETAFHALRSRVVLRDRLSAPHVSHFDNKHQELLDAQCKQVCGKKVPDCELLYTETCHADTVHEKTQCTEKCSNVFAICNHPCQKRCGEPCGSCKYALRPLSLRCSHTRYFECDQIFIPAAPREDTEGVARLYGCAYNIVPACGQVIG